MSAKRQRYEPLAAASALQKKRLAAEYQNKNDVSGGCAEGGVSVYSLLQKRANLVAEVQRMGIKVSLLKSELGALSAVRGNKQSVLIGSARYAHSTAVQHASDITLSDGALDAGALLPLRGCVSLKRLSILFRNSFCDLQQLEALKSLEEIRLVSQFRRLLNIPSLAEMPLLSKLYLQGECVDNDAVRHIFSIDTLEEASITDCSRLTAIENIHRASNLRALDVSRSGVDNKFVEDLHGCCALVKLSLSGCNSLTDITTLSAVKTLETLNLRYCSKLSLGVGALATLPRLHTLALTGTIIDDAVLEEVCKSTSLLTLDLSYCIRLTDVSALSALPTLRELDIDGCRSITVGLDSLGGLPQFCMAKCASTRITDACVRIIGKSKSLTVLSLPHCGYLSDITPLASITTLETLELRGCSWITKGLGSLSALPVLCTLDLSSSHINDEQFRELSLSKSIKALKLCDCEELTDITPISQMGSLERLYLWNCRNAKVGSDALPKLPRLSFLGFRKSGIALGIRVALEAKGVTIQAKPVYASV
ncbi:unnamed protein product [Trypanosoma congolense IL3000]|uniref:WGS project CAEQ00000000 data, annotated contig 1146 n=1 Tax=Trypanosoma congolense (strain IL3000) TaxID=1068625 RepID=F9W452_TRYCI|nr:unnamed protein product [Trypanosoma congolense IL3000]